MVHGTSIRMMDARSQAIEQDPSLDTAAGIVKREIMLTLGALASGREPQTILWGVVQSSWHEQPAVEKGQGRSKTQITVNARIDPVDYDGIFTTQEVLDSLTAQGVLVLDSPEPDTPAGLLARDETPGYRGATYILNLPKTLEIIPLSHDDKPDRVSQTSLMSVNRPGVVERWRRRRWVKNVTKRIRKETL